MTRADAITRAHTMLRSGEFLAELDRRVAYQTESQNPEKRDALRAYLTEALQPAFASMDFSTKLIESPAGKGPYLLAEYRENPSAPTVFFSSRRRHTRCGRDWSSDVCSSDLENDFPHCRGRNHRAQQSRQEDSAFCYSLERRCAHRAAHGASSFGDRDSDAN